MSEKEHVVGASHEFHDPAYARWWAEMFTVTDPRRECFDLISSMIVRTDAKVLELGSGPGYLANHLLSRFRELRYTCADYSQSMLTLSAEKLKEFPNASFVHVDLLDPRWATTLDVDYDYIVSTWALHDLGSELAIKAVYVKAKRMLKEGGKFLNADFIKPDGIDKKFESGRFCLDKHFAFLKEAGFSSACSLKEFEIDLNNPKSNNNYACICAEA